MPTAAPSPQGSPSAREQLHGQAGLTLRRTGRKGHSTRRGSGRESESGSGRRVRLERGNSIKTYHSPTPGPEGPAGGLQPSPGAQQERQRRCAQTPDTHGRGRHLSRVFPGSLRCWDLACRHAQFHVPPQRGKLQPRSGTAARGQHGQLNPGRKPLGREDRTRREPSVRAGVRVQQAFPEGEQNRETKGRTEPR